MSKQKGDKNERRARETYEDAGFEVENPNYSRYGNTDYYGLFDFMAIRGDRLVFAQVKTNSAQGVRGWMEDASELVPDGVELHFLVYHDYQGFRLMMPNGPPSYKTVVDERKSSCNWGEELLEFLED